MSLMFFVGFIMVFKGTLGMEIDNQFFYIWALFSIADALWWRAVNGK